MRNLKRALSLAMASIMLLGMMVMGASAATSYDDFSDKDKIVNTEAVNTMVSLGVLAGRDTGDFDPTGVVTRGEMAKIIAVMLNGGKDPTLGSAVSTFTDAKGHWAEAFIAFCANQGILNGYGDGTVKPNGTVTGTEAAKMILTALGYRSDIEKLTGANWALNTDTLANKVRLYDGLDIKPNEGLTRDSTAQMVYNAVQAEEVEYRNNYGEYSGVIYAQPKGTMLTNRFNAVKVTGVLMANDKLSVHTDGATALKDRSRLNVTAVTGYNENDNRNLFGDLSYKVVTSDEMVGQEIVIYVKFLNHLSPNAANSTVVGKAILTDNNKVVETTGRLKDADAVRSALREGGLSNIGAPTAYKFDHIGRTAGTATGITDTIAGGSTRSAGVLQRFIDNNGNGTPDYIIQIVPTLAGVTNVNKSTEKYTFSTPIGSQTYADVVSEDTLTKDQVVLITKYSDGKYYVTEPKTVEGKVTAFNTSNNKVTIDGTSYGNGAGAQLAISGVSKTLESGLVDNSYILYLDAYDNVLGFKETAVTIGNYAVVQGFTVTGSVSMGYSARVKILMQDGTTGTYDLDAANSAVKLGLPGITSGSTTAAKEAAIFIPTLLDPANRNGTALIGKLVSWSLDTNKTLTISNPVNINNKYTTADLQNATTMNKNTSTYVLIDGTTKVVADDNTVFFFKNSDGSYSVVTGLNRLPTTSLSMNGNGEVIYYTSANTATKAAKAISVKLNNIFASSKNYAFVSGDYTVGSDNGTQTFTYPVVLADGTKSTLISKSNNAAKNRVWEYTTDSGNYVTFSAPANHVYNARVDWIGNNSVGLVDAGSNAPIDSFVINNSAKIWDVQDTDNITSMTGVSENDIVAVIQDNIDKTVKAVFVYDSITGTLAAEPTAITLSSKTGALDISNANILNGTAQLRAAADTNTFKVTYTAAAGQKVTVKVNETTIQDKVLVVAGTLTVESASAYTITTADITKGYVTVAVTVTETDKDDYTKTVNVPVAYQYTKPDTSTVWANVGDTVELTGLTAGHLYQLSTVTDKTIAPMEVDAAGKLTFTMPAQAVTVGRVFKVTVPEAKTTSGVISNSTGWYTTNYKVGAVAVTGDVYLLAADTLTISITWEAGAIAGTTGDTFTASTTPAGGTVSGTAVFASGNFASAVTKTITISTWTADTVVSLSAANA